MGTSKDNLFSEEWTIGRLDSIDIIKNLLSTLSVWIISIIGFGIVIIVIGKNAINGLYAVAPKFWDRVDAVKTSKLAMQYMGADGNYSSENAITKRLGLGISALLSILPNIKAVSDFEDSPKNPREYFLVALPLAVAQIFVGVFIYYGYTTKISNKCADFATGVIDVALDNVDPLAWVKAIPTEWTTADLATDGAIDDVNKSINKITTKAWNTVVGELSEMTKENRKVVARQLEDWVISQSSSYTSYFNTDKYKMKYDASILLDSSVDKYLEMHHDKESNGIRTFAFCLPLNELQHGYTDGMTEQVEGKVVVVDLVFTPKASRTESTESVGCTAEGMKWTESASNPSMFTISAGSAGSDYGFKIVSGSTSISAKGVLANGNTVDLTISLGSDNGTLNVTIKDKSVTMSDIQYIAGMSALKYYKGTGEHTINTINKGNGSGQTQFKPSSTSSGIAPWVWGSEPTVSNGTDEDAGSENGTTAGAEGQSGPTGEESGPAGGPSINN